MKRGKEEKEEINKRKEGRKERERAERGKDRMYAPPSIVVGFVNTGWEWAWWGRVFAKLPG